jgi:hypothetical protein
VLRILTEHMSVYTGGDADALIFTGEKGGALRRSTFNRVVKWRDLVASMGVPGCISMIYAIPGTCSQRARGLRCEI